MNQLNLEESILVLGKKLYEEARVPSGGPLDPQHFTEKFLSWGMRDEDLKIALFRFVDVLPSLNDSASIIRHVQEYFEPLRGKLPDLLFKAMSISPDSLTSKVVSRAITKQIRYVAKRFIVGADVDEALAKLRKIHQRNMAFTVDLVGEAALSEEEAIAYLDSYLYLLNSLHVASQEWPENPILDKHRAGTTRVNISVKLSALYSQAKPIASIKSVEVLSERLSRILVEAKRVGAFVYVDMEDCSMTDITLSVFKETLDCSEFNDYPSFGIVLQAYLRRTENDLKDLIEWSKTRKAPIACRLVKGAYWDTETILARQNGWPIPVWQVKSSSDANYEKLSRLLLDNHETILPAFGSHNLRSLCHAIKYAESKGISANAYEVQTLYGMGDSIKSALVKRGILVREYSPIGELIPAMGYLVRRLLENTANEGFLKQSFHDQVSAEELLKKPEFAEQDLAPQDLEPQVEGFNNCPLLDFSLESSRRAVGDAIEAFRAEIASGPLVVQPIIGGEVFETTRTLDSVSPEDRELVVATQMLADSSLAEESIRQLSSYFSTWKNTPVEERADVLRNVAHILKERRAQFCALIVFEAGKPWAEADADVAEAIDFLRYYAHEAEKLFKPQTLGDYPGENNSYFYEPRGLTVVISPWNFPLAIPCGMFAAALVTGNCAILKPAEQTPLVASELFNIFLEAGLPDNAAAFLPGLGEEVGKYLAEHPSIDSIVFTGSKEVGLTLIREGAIHRPGAKHVKRVVAEMGGKNSIIVDEDAELDEAVKGVVYSAFGFQGQKCSACSKVIAVGNCYQRFVERLADAIESLVIGPATDPATFVGPVIDETSYNRIVSIINTAREDCSVIAEGNLLSLKNSRGFIVPPIAFGDIPDGHSIISDEIFGPVLAVMYAESFEEALSIALDSDYGLTGGLFSRSPNHIEKAAREFNVGNLYINRSCTGALVMRQPFGGAKMSGVGSKAGGPDYLLQFVIPRTVSENTMRRGFAPL